MKTPYHRWDGKVCARCGLRKKKINERMAYSMDDFTTFSRSTGNCTLANYGKFDLTKVKLCPKCNMVKNKSDFGNDLDAIDGLTSHCKNCRLGTGKVWIENNMHKLREYDKARYRTKKRQKWMKDYQKKVYEKTKEAHKFFYNIRRKSNHIIKRQTGDRGKKMKYLCCTRTEWMQYLEARFKPGMTWDNYGKAWEVDHIIPLSTVDRTDKNGLIKLSHYTNTQPLFKHENRLKSVTHDRQMIRNARQKATRSSKTDFHRKHG